MVRAVERLPQLRCTTPGGGVNGSGGATRFACCHATSLSNRIFGTSISLSRRFGITEGTKLEVLVEGFNLFNRTQVTTVQLTTIYTPRREPTF